MMHDYEFFLIQFAFMLPNPCVLMVVFDWNVFSNLQGSYWNRNSALNRPGSVLSVLTFLEKISSCQWSFLSGCVCILIRVVILAYVVVN